MKLFLFEYKYTNFGDNGGGIVFVGNSKDEFSHPDLITDEKSLTIHKATSKCEVVSYTHAKREELFQNLKELSPESYSQLVEEIDAIQEGQMFGKRDKEEGLIHIYDLAGSYKLRGGLFLIKEMEIGEQKECGIIADFSTPIA